MASSGGQAFKMKNPHDSSSGETITNPEVGLMETLQEYGDVKADLADMQRLGKKQEFDVGVPIFSRSPITETGQKLQSDCYLGIYFDLYGNMGICFSVKSRASTTDVASNARLTDGRSLSTGLTNGGFGGLFWVFIGTVLCYSSIVASLAEMTSMAPTRSANSFVTVSLKRGLTPATTYLLTFTLWMKRILTR
jgi:hypothetical protein